MSEANELLAMILGRKVSSVNKPRVAERVGQSKCLGESADGKDCDGTVYRRGLCSCCYHQFRMAKLGMSELKAMEYEGKLIRLGRLLQRDGAKAYQRPSFYRKAANS